MRISDWSSDVCSSDLTRSRARRKRLRAPRFFHALGRQPIEEFRDSSLFTLEIKNGIQFGTINVIEGKVQYLAFALLGLEFKTKHRCSSRIDGAIANAKQHSIGRA